MEVAVAVMRQGYAPREASRQTHARNANVIAPPYDRYRLVIRARETALRGDVVTPVGAGRPGGAHRRSAALVLRIEGEDLPGAWFAG